MFGQIVKAVGTLVAFGEAARPFKTRETPPVDLAHVEEERRRAEAALHAELRRQAVDREQGRLRLLAAAAMVGWITSVAILAAGFVGGTLGARLVVGAGWLLLLGALGAAFAGQGRVDGGFGTASLWLLLGGLAATGVSLLL